jgi:hypothetical protein
VGLPLAVEFATPQPFLRSGEGLRRRVIGFDIKSARVEELRQGLDPARPARRGRGRKGEQGAVDQQPSKSWTRQRCHGRRNAAMAYEQRESKSGSSARA